MARLVTVFGGSGFVGKQVVRSLAKKGWRVRVAVRKATEAYDLKPAGDVGQIQVVRCDIRNEADIARALEGADAVVNLVGVLFSTSSASFDAMHHQAPATIAKLAAARGIDDFVQMSALGADAGSDSKYLKSKAQGEAAVLTAIPSAVILRPSLIFGPGDGFICGLAQQIKTFPVMPAIEGGKTKFQPVYVGDVAAAVTEVLGKADARGKIFELGGPEVQTFSELVDYVSKEILVPRKQVWLPLVVAKAIGTVGDILLVASPFKPLLTSDQVIMLQTDNVVSAGAPGLKELGITPTALDSIAPSYLWPYRKGGQFALA